MLITAATTASVAAVVVNNSDGDDGGVNSSNNSNTEQPCFHRHRCRRQCRYNNFASLWLLSILFFSCFIPLTNAGGRAGSTKTLVPHSFIDGRLEGHDAPLKVHLSDAGPFLRSGVVQHAAHGVSSGTSSAELSGSSSSSSREIGTSLYGPIKMAATRGKNRGLSSSLSSNRAGSSRANANSLFYPGTVPVPGVDPSVYEKLYNRTSMEMKIKRVLLYTGLYDKTSRPVAQDRDNVTVHIGISLYHILDTNEKYQTISLLIAVRLKWHDAMLRWDPRDFDNVEQIWLPSDLIWCPDIVINNNADHEVKMQTNAIVEYTGEVLWMYPQLAKIYCTLDVRNFPFDVQYCDIKFFSWTYNGYQIDLMTTESENPSYFDEANQEWNVLSIRGKRNVAVYACCPEPFPDISFTLKMKRRSMFYIFNLIFPCMLIYAVAFLGFFLPIESNEKINLEVTILLALVVFLMVIGETMPPSPDAIPLLGMLYASTMMMVSIALVSAVAVTNVYYKEKYGEQVPRWLFRLLYWNADLPCPKCKMPQRMLRSAQFDKTTGMAVRKPFKNTSFMMAPPSPYPGLDYNVSALDPVPHPGNVTASDDFALSAPSLKSPTHRRAAWIKASTSTNAGTLQQVTSDGATQCTSLNQQISVASDDDYDISNNNTAFLQSPGHKRRVGGTESPVWKQRGNGTGGEFAIASSFEAWLKGQQDPAIFQLTPSQQFQAFLQQQPQQVSQQQFRQQQQQPYQQLPHHRPSSSRSRPAKFVRQMSDGGTSTRFVRTDAGCVHITISWREIAERIDGILFWAFLVSSVVVFTLIFVTVDYEEDNK